MKTIILTAVCPAGHTLTLPVLGGAGAVILANMIAGTFPPRPCAVCGQPMGTFGMKEETTRPPPANGAAVGK